MVEALHQVERRVDEVVADRLQFAVGEIALGDAAPARRIAALSKCGISRAVVEGRPVGVGAVIGKPFRNDVSVLQPPLTAMLMKRSFGTPTVSRLITPPPNSPGYCGE